MPSDVKPFGMRLERTWRRLPSLRIRDGFPPTDSSWHARYGMDFVLAPGLGPWMARGAFAYTGSARREEVRRGRVALAIAR